MISNNGARELFKKSGLNYGVLTKNNLQQLRNIINLRMKKSGNIKNSYRCKQRPFIHTNNGDGRFYAGIRCKSFYFDNREAVSFNPDGFIGFAGWADSTNIRPILDGFAEWVNLLALNNPKNPTHLLK